MRKWMRPTTTDKNHISDRRRTCMSCREHIKPGVVHVLAKSGFCGYEQGGHWHTKCYKATEEAENRRGPKVLRDIFKF